MNGGSDDRGRRDADLVTALGTVRSRIAEACAAAGRDSQTVTLIAVTKTYPAADVATLARLGVQDVGESKDQEARAKIAELDEGPVLPVTLRWHVIGRLQTNKARSVARYATSVHSVDRPKLARALADACADRSLGRLDVFAQVSLDDDPDRGGVARTKLAALADCIAERPELRLRGLTGVPPMDADPDESFAELARLSANLRESHPGADALSAGMSADLEAAIRNGATHVRVGSALLGRRPPTLG